METMTPPQAVGRRRFTVEEYYAMGEAGIFGAEERVELIDGEITMLLLPIGSRHSAILDRLVRLLAPYVLDHSDVRVQNPIRLDERSEPEPDLALVRLGPDYFERLPGPADVLLAVEVSDATLAFDRDVKRPLYARHGIAELWIVDVRGRRVLVHRRPSGDAYEEVTAFGPDAVLAPEAFPDAEVLLHEILR